MQIVFATNNAHKLREVQQLLGNTVHLINLKDIGCNEDIPEEQATIEGNASQKSFYIYNNYAQNCFADDTGLEIEALNWEPGVYSARYAGDHKDMRANIQKALNGLKNKENKFARFKTIISLVIDGKEIQFEGIVNGKMIEQERGTNGFGYDPVFVPEGYTKTYAEMTDTEKNAISHRGIAVRKLVEYLNTQI